MKSPGLIPIVRKTAKLPPKRRDRRHFHREPEAPAHHAFADTSVLDCAILRFIFNNAVGIPKKVALLMKHFIPKKVCGNGSPEFTFERTILVPLSMAGGILTLSSGASFASATKFTTLTCLGNLVRVARSCDGLSESPHGNPLPERTKNEPYSSAIILLCVVAWN